MPNEGYVMRPMEEQLGAEYSRNRCEPLLSKMPQQRYTANRFQLIQENRALFCAIFGTGIEISNMILLSNVQLHERMIDAKEAFSDSRTEQLIPNADELLMRLANLQEMNTKLLKIVKSVFNANFN